MDGIFSRTMPQHVPTYATSFGRAFAEALANHPELGEPMRAISKTYAGERIAIGVAHEALELLIRLTGDEDLGLKAARRLRMGDAGPVDYLLRSAATVRRAIESASVYARLLNEVLDIELVLEGDLAFLRLDNSVRLPRAALDFQAGGIFRTHVRHWFGDRLADVTVCFPHAAPADLTEYHETFDGVALSFARPALGFAFERRRLELTLENADPCLEELLSRQAERALGSLGSSKGIGADVRRAVVQTLPQRRASLVRVASRFGISASTLARRLDEEGTSFREILDAARRDLAGTYLRQSPLEVADIARRVGFSDVGAFGRAFRRWTGQSPGEYRRRSELM